MLCLLRYFLSMKILLQPTLSLPAKPNILISLVFNAFGAVALCPYNLGVGIAFHLMKVHRLILSTKDTLVSTSQLHAARQNLVCGRWRWRLSLAFYPYSSSSPDTLKLLTIQQEGQVGASVMDGWALSLGIEIKDRWVWETLIAKKATHLAPPTLGT